MKFKALIEIPEGSLEKTEVKDGVASVDRLVTIPYPAAYGFVPGTLEKDGDPLDIFVLSKKPLKTLDLVDVKLLGLFKCTDQDLEDNKLLAIVENEHFDELTILKYMTSIGDFLLNYKSGFKVLDYTTDKKELRRVEMKIASAEVINRHNGVLKKLEN